MPTSPKHVYSMMFLATKQHWPAATGNPGRRHGPRDQKGPEHTAPEANPDPDTTAPVGRRMYVDPSVTQHESDPDSDPGAEIEPKQDNRHGIRGK
jgi:hypothetical protein